MSMEKRLKAVPPQAFIADGNAVGQVTIANTSLFKVKQHVVLVAIGQANLTLEIKRVLDDGSNTMLVGPVKGNIDSRSDISLYTVAANAYIYANEQQRPSIPEQEIERLTYEEEPTIARRVILVDELGNKINASNPLPVDATVTIPSVDVALDSFTKVPPDNVLIVGSEDGTKTGTKHAVVIDSDKNLHVINMGQLVPNIFDAIAVTYPSVSQEAYTYKIGGIAGVTVATVTVIYTDATKTVLTSVART